MFSPDHHESIPRNLVFFESERIIVSQHPSTVLDHQHVPSDGGGSAHRGVRHLRFGSVRDHDCGVIVMLMRTTRWSDPSKSNHIPTHWSYSTGVMSAKVRVMLPTPTGGHDGGYRPSHRGHASRSVNSSTVRRSAQMACPSPGQRWCPRERSGSPPAW